jgi:gliding motility-associated protein GldM
MAGGKETPRQKMIGMMYLVLTALLAMNISKDVLDAFIQINKGLGKTNGILDEKADATKASLDNAMASDPKAVPFAQKAAEVDKLTNDIMAYMEEMKARVIASSLNGNSDGSGFEEYFKDGKCIEPDATEDGKPDGHRIISKPDENQNNTALLVGPNPEAPHTTAFSAGELRAKLTEFRDKLANLSFARADSGSFTLPEDVKQSIAKSFAFEEGLDHDGKSSPWETHNFFHMPLVAVLANLSKIQTDVMNTRNNVTLALAHGVNANDMKFSDVRVAVVPKQSYVLRGDEFEAEIYLAAYNKTSQTKLYKGGEYSGPMPTEAAAFQTSGDGEVSGPDGICRWKVNTGGMSLGEHGYRGMLEYQDASGAWQKLPFVVPPFYVGEAALVVSPVQMNVFYRGLDNPVEISVPGVGADKLKPSCEGCETFSKGENGQWVVRPSQGQKATISVSADINGQTKSIGSKEFRIKRIPDPIPSFNNKRPTDGTIGVADARVAPGVRAEMEGFDFNVTVKVKSFRLTVTKGGSFVEDKSNSNTVTDKMKEFLKNAKAGDRIFIEEIMVSMPDGTERKLAPITLRVV